MEYPIQTLHIILLHILCPNHQKYVGLDYVFDHEKGEVSCQNEIVRYNSYYWLCAMCMDEKRFGRKSKWQYCNCYLLHLMTANRKALFERTSLQVVQSRVGAVTKFANHFLIFNLHVRGNKKAWPKWVWPKWVWPENQVSMIFVSIQIEYRKFHSG